MPPPSPGKTLRNERNYPYIVELAVHTHGLDVELSRRVMEFHITTHSAAIRTCNRQAFLLSLVLCRFADRYRFHRTVWRRVVQAKHLSLARGQTIHQAVDQSTAAPGGAVCRFLFIGHAANRNAHLRLAFSKFAVALCERNGVTCWLRVGISL